MEKNGSITKTGIRDSLALAFAYSGKIRARREASQIQKQYQSSFEKINNVLKQAIKLAENNPEYGIAVSRQCTRFVMKSMPDPAQDSKRAVMFGQYEMLETSLAKVRNPEKYLASMQEQFGPDLDPKKYPAAADGFNTIISSQKDRIYRDSQGFNDHLEKVFCNNRRELLNNIEKGYNKLRNHALGIPSNDKEKGLGR